MKSRIMYDDFSCINRLKKKVKLGKKKFKEKLFHGQFLFFVSGHFIFTSIIMKIQGYVFHAYSQYKCTPVFNYTS